MRRAACTAALLLWIGCRTGSDENVEVSRAERTAADAMRALGEASADLTKWFLPAVKDLPNAVANPKDAAKRIEALLPKLDAYLETADHALLTADDYLRLRPDPTIKGKVALLRSRIATIHDARRTLDAIRGELERDGLTLGDLANLRGRLAALAGALIINAGG
jgi:hypothetical protein